MHITLHEYESEAAANGRPAFFISFPGSVEDPETLRKIREVIQSWGTPPSTVELAQYYKGERENLGNVEDFLNNK